MTFNPDFEGIWKPKGASGDFPTYRVDNAGKYFVAYPAVPISFRGGGTKLNWGGATYTKLFGNAGEIPGVWIGDADGDELNFRKDGTYTAHVSPTDEYFGNYEVRDPDTDATTLWTEEFRGLITSSNFQVVFDPPYLPDSSYDYAITEPNWTLFDLGTGAIVFEYERTS